MVLLPKVPSPKEKEENPRTNVFFEDDRLDYLAKYFVGNNNRYRFPNYSFRMATNRISPVLLVGINLTCIV